MPLITISIGVLLMLQGAGFYIASDTGSWTPAIPAIPGVVFFICGYIALLAPKARKHVLHVAMLIAALGMVMALIRGVPALMADPAPNEKIDAVVQEGMLSHLEATAKLTSIHWAKVWDQLLMAFWCALLVGLGVRSFMQSRRSMPAAKGAG
jgi:hypothetical protein